MKVFVPVILPDGNSMDSHVPVWNENGGFAIHQTLDGARKTLWDSYIEPFFDCRADWTDNTDPCYLLAHSDDYAEIFSLLEKHYQYLRDEKVIPDKLTWDIIEVDIQP